jgi:hypothetical protein
MCDLNRILFKGRFLKRSDKSPVSRDICEKRVLYQGQFSVFTVYGIDPVKNAKLIFKVA